MLSFLIVAKFLVILFTFSESNFLLMDFEYNESAIRETILANNSENTIDCNNSNRNERLKIKKAIEKASINNAHRYCNKFCLLIFGNMISPISFPDDFIHFFSIIYVTCKHEKKITSSVEINKKVLIDFVFLR